MRKKGFSAKNADILKDKIILQKEQDVSSFYELVRRYLNLFCLDPVKKLGYIWYLPASRSGLYQSLSAFSQIFAELSKSRSILKKKVEIPSIPEPVSDYFLGLSNIKKRETNKNNEILSIVRDMEKNLLKGEVTFDDVTKKIVYKPYQTGLNLDISLASSMVSEISPVVSYLKYIIADSASEKDSEYLMFIEEPEAHLHPEAQIQLMEVFAKLVRSGVKIVMTSHSNYMFNKLNNLILEGKIDTDSARAVVFKDTGKGSIAQDIPVDELGMDDENFLDSTENLLNEKLELIEKINQGNV